MAKRKSYSAMSKILPLKNALMQYRHLYDNKGADYSVTDLIQPPRIALLKKRYWKEILQKPIDPKREIDSFSGTGLHHMFESNLKNDPTYILEDRMGIKYLERKISGCPDIFHIPTFNLYDVKMTKAWKKIFSDLSEWEEQLNLYAYLLYVVKDIRVTKLFIIAWWKNFDERSAMDNPNYPREPVENLEMKLWTIKEQKKFLYDRLNMMIDAEPLADDELPECAAKDRWDKTSTWAVYKLLKNGKKPKKASRVVYSEKDAKRWADKMIPKGKPYRIESRPGARERCDNWCDVSDWCNQYKKYMEENK